MQEFFRLLEERGICLPERIQFACIGRITAKKLEECCRQADIVADASDVDGLLEAIAASIKHL